MTSGMHAQDKTLWHDMPGQAKKRGTEMRWVWIGFLALGLSGCASLPAAQDDGPKMASAMVGIVNHTEKYVYSASVNGAGGGNMDEYAAGGAEVCCAMIPSKWYPGLKATVRVTFAVGRKLTGLSKVVEVEPYNEAGSIFIHLFPNDEVRVIVTRYGGSSTKHPIPAPVKPAGWKRTE